MSVTATVATRPLAAQVALSPPATSISDMIQPPKISPAGLVSAGMASVRTDSSPLGPSGDPPGTGVPSATAGPR